MVDPGDALDAGRSVLVGIALDQLQLRTRPIMVAFAVVALLGLVGVVVLDDAARVVAFVVVVLGVVALAIVLVVGFLARRVLRSIAPPTEVKDHRDAIQDAIDQLALPTGPISGLKFAWGLRDGIDDELANADDVITTLRERLNV